MKTVGMATLESDEPEKNLRFAYLISRWLGVFAYLAAIWIGSFSTMSIVESIINVSFDINFVLNGLVTMLTFVTGTIGLIAILRGNMLLERIVIWPVTIGLFALTTVYAYANLKDIMQGIDVSPVAGINGAVLTGMIIYLIVRATWINLTMKRTTKNRNDNENINL